jgi:SAM-dependent methyltransferase
MDVEALCERVMSSDKIVLPDNAEFTGGSRDNFLSVGCSVFRELVRTTALAPDSRVLEIGSGLGRIAYPLALYLKHGHYVGLEIVKDSVEFCARHVTPLAAPTSRFEFIHVDVHNEFYNPDSETRLADYAFPEFGEFDVVFMSSVCTHLNDKELKIYLRKAAQWTKRGGDFWATFFLVDSAVEYRLAEHRSEASLPFDLSAQGPDYYLDARCSTVAVAYRIDYVRSLYASRGFDLKELDLGVWSGAKRDYAGYQDLIVATKV